MLVLLTIVGLSLGWVAAQLKWIRDRHQAIQWVNGHKTHSVVIGHHVDPPPYRRVDPPWQLRLFGEKGCDLISVRIRVDETNGRKN